MKSQYRNLHPIPEAIVARIIWGKEYSEQRGGTMDFWDGLDMGRRNRCCLVVAAIKPKRKKIAPKEKK